MEKSNLENLYNDKIVKSLLDDLGVKNIMQVPKLKKIGGKKTELPKLKLPKLKKIEA